MVVFLPTPQKRSTNKLSIKSGASASVITNSPLGLLKSDAIFAKNLLYEMPAEPVNWVRSCILSFISCAIFIASSNVDAIAVISKKASSSDKGSINSVYSRNIS